MSRAVRPNIPISGHQGSTSEVPKIAAVRVEERDITTVVVHGCLGGLVAGLALGVAAIVSSTALSGSASSPFRFAAAFVVGPDAFASTFPLGVALLLGTAIHFALSVVFGMLFVGLLALTYQLSARAWLLVLYGSAFAFAVWEVDFLAIVPTFFPYLAGRLDLATQLWNGIISYLFVYGPALGIYVALFRPGVVDDWRAVGPPAGTYGPGREGR